MIGVARSLEQNIIFTFDENMKQKKRFFHAAAGENG